MSRVILKCSTLARTYGLDWISDASSHVQKKCLYCISTMGACIMSGHLMVQRAAHPTGSRTPAFEGRLSLNNMALFVEAVSLLVPLEGRILMWCH